MAGFAKAAEQTAELNVVEKVVHAMQDVVVGAPATATTVVVIILVILMVAVLHTAHLDQTTVIRQQHITTITTHAQQMD